MKEEEDEVVVSQYRLQTLRERREAAWHLAVSSSTVVDVVSIDSD